ncbi:MAG: hypothetical protein IT434_19065 [Phycisphaerales bacterium]|nr:hypothetical protein [Phycisphaerales bacterium]
MSEYKNPSHEEMNAQMGSSQTASGSTSQGQSNPGSNQSTSGATGHTPGGQELIDELGRLGNKMAEVIRTAWASDERKRMEQDLRTGLNTLANNLEQGVRKMGEHEQTKEFVRKAEDVAENVGEKVRNSQTTYDIAGALAGGLRVLADQVEKLAAELQRKRAETPTTPPTANDDSQDIPIGRV